MTDVPFYLGEIREIDPSAYEELPSPYEKFIRLDSVAPMKVSDERSYATAPYEMRSFRVRDGKQRVQVITVVVSRIVAVDA